MKKICLAGDGWGAVAALISLQKKYNAVAVVTGDDDLLLKLRSQDMHLDSFYDTAFDLVICAGYKPFVPKDIVEKKCILNIHYSLLPKYRGMHSTVWAIINGEQQLGLTVHEMNAFMDDGDIVAQHIIEYRGQTASDVMLECNAYIEKNLGSIVDEYLNGNVKIIPQDKSIATWVCKRNLSDCLIDFSSSSSQLKRFFKALVEPYPLPMIKVNEILYEVVDCVIYERKYFMTNGRVVNIDNEGVWIKIDDGLLVVKQVRRFQSLSQEDAQSVFKIGMRL